MEFFNATPRKRLLDRICSREIVSSKAQRIRSIFFSSSNESVEHIKGISCDIFMENIDCMISDASKYYEVSTTKKLFIGSLASQHLSEVGMFTTKTSAFSISEFNPILFRFISLTIERIALSRDFC